MDLFVKVERIDKIPADLSNVQVLIKWNYGDRVGVTPSFRLEVPGQASVHHLGLIGDYINIVPTSLLLSVFTAHKSDFHSDSGYSEQLGAAIWRPKLREGKEDQPQRLSLPVRWSKGSLMCLPPMELTFLCVAVPNHRGAPAAGAMVSAPRTPMPTRTPNPARGRSTSAARTADASSLVPPLQQGQISVLTPHRRTAAPPGVPTAATPALPPTPTIATKQGALHSPPHVMWSPSVPRHAPSIPSRGAPADVPALRGVDLLASVPPPPAPAASLADASGGGGAQAAGGRLGASGAARTRSIDGRDGCVRGTSPAPPGATHGGATAGAGAAASGGGASGGGSGAITGALRAAARWRSSSRSGMGVARGASVGGGGASGWVVGREECGARPPLQSAYAQQVHLQQQQQQNQMAASRVSAAAAAAVVPPHLTEPKPVSRTTADAGASRSTAGAGAAAVGGAIGSIAAVGGGTAAGGGAWPAPRRALSQPRATSPSTRVASPSSRVPSGPQGGASPHASAHAHPQGPVGRSETHAARVEGTSASTRGDVGTKDGGGGGAFGGVGWTGASSGAATAQRTRGASLPSSSSSRIRTASASVPRARAPTAGGGLPTLASSSSAPTPHGGAAQATSTVTAATANRGMGGVANTIGGPDETGGATSGAGASGVGGAGGGGVVGSLGVMLGGTRRGRSTDARSAVSSPTSGNGAGPANAPAPSGATSAIGTLTVSPAGVAATAATTAAASAVRDPSAPSRARSVTFALPRQMSADAPHRRAQKPSRAPSAAQGPLHEGTHVPTAADAQVASAAMPVGAAIASGGLPAGGGMRTVMPVGTSPVPHSLGRGPSAGVSSEHAAGVPGREQSTAGGRGPSSGGRAASAGLRRAQSVAAPNEGRSGQSPPAAQHDATRAPDATSGDVGERAAAGLSPAAVAAAHMMRNVTATATHAVGAATAVVPSSQPLRVHTPPPRVAGSAVPESDPTDPWASPVGAKQVSYDDYCDPGACGYATAPPRIVQHTQPPPLQQHHQPPPPQRGAQYQPPQPQYQQHQPVPTAAAVPASAVPSAAGGTAGGPVYMGGHAYVHTDGAHQQHQNPRGHAGDGDMYTADGYMYNGAEMYDGATAAAAAGGCVAWQHQQAWTGVPGDASNDVDDWANASTPTNHTTGHSNSNSSAANNPLAVWGSPRGRASRGSLSPLRPRLPHGAGGDTEDDYERARRGSGVPPAAAAAPAVPPGDLVWGHSGAAAGGAGRGSGSNGGVGGAVSGGQRRGRASSVPTASAQQAHAQPGGVFVGGPHAAPMSNGASAGRHPVPPLRPTSSMTGYEMTAATTASGRSDPTSAAVAAAAAAPPPPHLSAAHTAAHHASSSVHPPAPLRSINSATAAAPPPSLAPAASAPSASAVPMHPRVSGNTSGNGLGLMTSSSAVAGLWDAIPSPPPLGTAPRVTRLGQSGVVSTGGGGVGVGVGAVPRAGAPLAPCQPTAPRVRAGTAVPLAPGHSSSSVVGVLHKPSASVVHMSSIPTSVVHPSSAASSSVAPAAVATAAGGAGPTGVAAPGGTKVGTAVQPPRVLTAVERENYITSESSKEALRRDIHMYHAYV